MDRRTRKRFSWNGDYWSCTHEVWGKVTAVINNDEPFDLEALGCRRIKTEPFYLKQWAERGAHPFPPLTKDKHCV